MNPTDDDAAERARLERIAWGEGSNPADAARARIALADLPRRRRRPTSGADATSGGGRTAATPSAWSPSGAADATAGSLADPRSLPDSAAATPARSAAVRPSLPDSAAAGREDVDGPGRSDRSQGRPAPAASTDDAAGGAAAARSTAAADVGASEGRDRSGADARRDEWRAVADGTAGREAGHRSGARVPADGQCGPVDELRTSDAESRVDTDAAPEAGAGDHGTDASETAGRGSGLPAGVRGLVARVRRADRTALWVAAGVAVVVGLAVGTGAGVAVGTGRSAQPGTAVVTPTAGTVTVEQLLAAPQTYNDELPGAIDAPVMLRSTRLVFTNRSLAGDDASTPWAVWAGTGRDGKMICLVASADRLQGSSACYPREDALHGTVSMTAMSSSGTLWVSLKGGAVLATVTGSY